MGASSVEPKAGASEPQQALDAERLLVEQAKRDPLAFGRLFDAHYDRILNYVLHRTADVYVAQELTSNVFFQAMKSMPKFRWRGVPFSAWLYRIAANEVRGHYRRRARTPVETVADVGAYPSLDTAAAADSEILRAQQAVAENRVFLELHGAISRLDHKYQEALVLHYFEGKSVAEIAQIMERPAATVKTLLHRARLQLRARLSTSYLTLVE